MAFTFVPEYRFDTFDSVTVDFLRKRKIKGVILDIDNTLEPYENEKPGEHVIRWLSSLNEAGIKTAIVSNNDRQRVETFNKDIGMPAYYKAKKPFKKNVMAAMKAMGTSMENTVLMGDQVFTDVWAAHNAGMIAILVPPIRDKRDLLTKFKRLLEKPVLKKYERNRLK